MHEQNCSGKQKEKSAWTNYSYTFIAKQVNNNVTHACTHTCAHAHTWERERQHVACLRTCTRVHAYTCIHVCTHTCTAATGHFSVTWHTWTCITTTATHFHEHTCTCMQHERPVTCSWSICALPGSTARYMCRFKHTATDPRDRDACVLEWAGLS